MSSSAAARTQLLMAASVSMRDSADADVSSSTALQVKIMVAVFSILATLSLVQLKMIGIGLAAAVLIDATVVRGILLPAALALLGDRSWYLPRWLAWLPAPPPRPRAGASSPRRVRSEPLRRVIGNLAPAHGVRRAPYLFEGRTAEHGPAEGPVDAPQPQFIQLSLVQPGRRVPAQEVPDEIPLVLFAPLGEPLHAGRRLLAGPARAGRVPVDHHERAITPDQHLAVPVSEAGRWRVQPRQDALGPLASRRRPAVVLEQRPVLGPPPLAWIAVPAHAAGNLASVETFEPADELAELGGEPMAGGRVAGGQLGAGDVLHLPGYVESCPGVGQVVGAVLELQDREAAGAERRKHEDLPSHHVSHVGTRKGELQVARSEPGGESQPEDVGFVRRDPLDGSETVVKASRDTPRKS